MPSRLALGVLLLLAGCADPIVGREGPVQVILGSTWSTREACERTGRAMGRDVTVPPGYRLRGCVHRAPGDPVTTIYCTNGDARCLAHEIRHLLDRGWKHE